EAAGGDHRARLALDRVADHAAAVDRHVDAVDAVGGEADMRAAAEAVGDGDRVAAARAGRGRGVLDHGERVGRAQVQIAANEGDRTHRTAVRRHADALHHLRLIWAERRWVHVRDANDVAVLEEADIEVAVRAERNGGRLVAGEAAIRREQSDLVPDR